MAFSKTYINPSLGSADALYQAFVSAGLDDVIIELNGDLHISTETGDQATCDAVVASAVPGSLIANKMDRIRAIEQTTAALLSQGVETWSAGIYAALNKIDADGWYTDCQYFLANPSELSASKPYPVRTHDGRAIMTDDINDIKILVDNAAARLTYLYRDDSNADGSKGEMHIIGDIGRAVDQAALDAIIDTRT